MHRARHPTWRAKFRENLWRKDASRAQPPLVEWHGELSSGCVRCHDSGIKKHESIWIMFKHARPFSIRYDGHFALFNSVGSFPSEYLIFLAIPQNDGWTSKYPHSKNLCHRPRANGRDTFDMFAFNPAFQFQRFFRFPHQRGQYCFQ